MSGIKTAGKVAHYVIMPGIIPRFKTLFTSGFGYIAFLMAQIYGMVRLIPPGHAYLNPQNIGKFTIRQTIAEAANNLIFSRKNIDQIIIFAALLIGITLLALQVAMIILSLIFEPAMANIIEQGPSMFVTPNPAGDIAYMLLDQVFGIPDLYGSCISTGATCPGDLTRTATAFPWPLHTALHELFRFYSTGILFVGLLIFLYFVVIVIGESAATGTPFGQRFQNVWVPVRLIVAIGLLVPVNYGLNASQYVTLFAAKFGSSFATNGWIRYNNVIHNDPLFDDGGANPTGEKESLIGFPKPPAAAPIIQAMTLAHTCAYAYWRADGTVSQGDLIPPSSSFYIQPYLAKAPPPPPAAGGTDNLNRDRILRLTEGTTYQQAVEFYNMRDITIVFGAREIEIPGDNGKIYVVDTANPGNEEGTLQPLCGQIRISLNDLTSFGEGSPPMTGPEKIQEHFFKLIKEMWFSNTKIHNFSRYLVARHIRENLTGMTSCDFTDATLPSSPACEVEAPGASWKQKIIEEEQGKLNAALLTIWEEYSDGVEAYEMTPEIMERGWGGAGIWFNKISRLNGDMITANMTPPRMSKFPSIMEEVRKQHAQSDNIVFGSESYSLQLANGRPVDLTQEDQQIARVLSLLYNYWNSDGQDQSNEGGLITGSALEDGITMIFGAYGLFAMTDENAHIHPLAQLTMLGKGLVEASIRNVVLSTIGGAAGGLLGAIDRMPAQLMSTFSQFLLSTAFVGLTAGLVLYYVLPFLPFVYFYFAVAGWVKSIFEAMVGAPLWALAHMRIDGEGLPGQSAANGYFLIMEIFLRPILSVFGLIASILIFTAQVRVLNFLWQIVTKNVAGYNTNPIITFSPLEYTFNRGIIDEFFFTIIYAIIVYMMAIAAFKLIDKIPDNILRWAGTGVSSYSDINQDATEGLTRYAAMGGLTAGQEASQAIYGLGSGAGGTLGSLFARMGGTGATR